MKKIIFSTMFFLVYSSLATAAECPALPKSDTYKIKEKFVSIGSDFEIRTGRKPVGKVLERVLNFGRTFELVNEENKVIAKAVEERMLVGKKIQILDCNDEVIATIAKKSLKSLFIIGSEYEILKPRKEEAGHSVTKDWLETEIKFYAKDGPKDKEAAVLSRSTANGYTDQWDLYLDKDAKESLDPRIFFFTAAYKTASDRASKNAAAAASARAKTTGKN